MNLLASLMPLGILLIEGVWTSDNVYNLTQNLLKNYDRNVRPARSHRNTTTVKLGMALNQIIGLDERNQQLTINVWFRSNWVDTHLSWDPEEYDGVKDIRLNVNQIWRPDIALYNDVRATMKDVEKVFPATIYSDGVVFWGAPMIMKSSCRLDVTYFPWDVQACHLKFGSWTYHGFDVDITNRSAAGDLANFIPDGQWELIKMPVRRNNVLYSCCVEPYPDVTFWIVLRRIPLYYVFHLVFPCAFITFTTMFVFFLPPESGEKISLGITALLALTVFLLLVAESLPPQSLVVPLIAQYFGATIVLLSMSTSLTVCILNLHYRGIQGKPVPHWVRMFCHDYLSYVVCMRYYIENERRKNVEYAKYLQIEENELLSQFFPLSKAEAGKSEVPHSKGEEVKEEPEKMDTIIGYLKDFKLNMNIDTRRECIVRDWCIIASLFDRLFLFIFIISTVVMTSTIMMSNKMNDDAYVPPPVV